LFFRVEEIRQPVDRLDKLNNDFGQIPNNIGNINDIAILNQSLQHHKGEFTDETNQVINTVEDLILLELIRFTTT